MSYAGDVTPQDAYAALQSDERAVLVDVRTRAEWQFVGVPDLSSLGRPVVTIEWTTYPEGARNAGFVEQLQFAGVQKGTPVYFLCRSGVRSVAAAQEATAGGLGPAFNVLDGFEGPHDEQGHRSVAGWKVAGLPWTQG